MKKLGRPSKYKPEYDQALIDHMGSGLSYLCFGVTIGVNTDTLYEWEKLHPTFAEAKKQAFEMNRLFWEKAGTQGLNSGRLNSTVWIFNMKNRFPKEWRDRQEIESINVNNNIEVDKKDLLNIIKLAKSEKIKS